MLPQVIKTVQLFTIPLARLLLWPILGTKSIRLKLSDLDSDFNYVIVANHSGVPDALVVCYSLSTKISIRLAPYRFFTKNVLFRNFLVRPIIILFGCFRARRELNKPSGLDYGISLINSSQTIVIFPEGKVSRLDRKILPRTGVETLAAIPNVKLIPARVKWNRKKGLWKSYSLSVGKPFGAKNMTADQIMDVVYDLKFR